MNDRQTHRTRRDRRDRRTPTPPATTRASAGSLLAAALLALSLACAFLAATSAPAGAQVISAGAQTAHATAGGEGRGNALESAASKAGETGRKVAMSLIGLAFALTGIALAFKRDFKEAAGVFAVGLVAVLLATPAGVSLLRDTVSSLFGAS